MLYLESFTLPSEGEESNFLLRAPKCRRTCYTSRYPFGIFPQKQLTEVTFSPITIFHGGNGSGKTTLLNLIGETLQLQRGAVFNRSGFWDDYLRLCSFESAPSFRREIRNNSRVITSDDVFDYLLDLRCLNENIDSRRTELLSEYTDKRYAKMQLRSLADLDELRKVVDAQRKTGSRYVRDQVMNDIPEQSNGESAFLYFTREITQDGLYLLDEPENSLSAKLQLELAQFLEDAVRFYRCQLVIATHSPFLLALKDAVVYDMDSCPVSPCPWTELENIRMYHDFFESHRREFD